MIIRLRCELHKMCPGLLSSIARSPCGFLLWSLWMFASCRKCRNRRMKRTQRDGQNWNTQKHQRSKVSGRTGTEAVLRKHLTAAWLCRLYVYGTLNHSMLPYAWAFQRKIWTQRLRDTVDFIILAMARPLSGTIQLLVLFWSVRICKNSSDHSILCRTWWFTRAPSILDLCKYHLRGTRLFWFVSRPQEKTWQTHAKHVH